MKSILINIGRADIKEAEKQINEKISNLEKFVSLKTTSNGQNDMAVVLYDGESEIKKPAVKIIEFSITDTDEAAKKIDVELEKLKDAGVKVISIEPICVVDMNRLIIVYDAPEEKKNNAQDTDHRE